MKISVRIDHDSSKYSAGTTVIKVLNSALMTINWLKKMGTMVFQEVFQPSV